MENREVSQGPTTKGATVCTPGKTGNVIPSGNQLARTPLASSTKRWSSQKTLEPAGEHTHCKKLRHSNRRAAEESHTSSSLTSGEEAISRVGQGRNSSRKELQSSIVHVSGDRPLRRSSRAANLSASNPREGNQSSITKKKRESTTKESKSLRRLSQLPVQGFNAMNTSGIIRGMQGNNWTEADLEFVQRMKNEKSVMQLKEELKRLQRELKDEMQKKELLWAQKEKIQTDTVNMEETIDRTVQLGRAFLCRKMDPSIVEPLSPESVLKQLSVASVQQVIQQETAKLQALEEKLTGKQKQASHQIKQLQIEMRNKEMYYLEKIKSHKGKVLMEQELVDNLKDELSELQEKLAETQEHFKSMKSQIEDLQAKQMENYSGTVNMAKIEQRLKRLERRKELFLERRRIMQRLCSMDR
ncbi:calponin homology domain-containing protein DDB_G0272472 isoform X2 [Acipenser ruthenus]|uniref:calponin homology domain-containing protein DDB_G0272472 isoform X2 n=1 Tax=Acipenser ruthenus TaxID=7906 RepID=UPI0027429BA6|nr:calponin homology domain-containing protein DDB_G0272472 isoform X2 [Acipenser ruthenus]